MTPENPDNKVRRGIDPWQKGRGVRILKVLTFIKKQGKCSMRDIRGHFILQVTEDGTPTSWHPNTTEKYVYDLRDAGYVVVLDDDTVIYLQPEKQQTSDQSTSDVKKL